MNTSELLLQSISGTFLNFGEALYLYKNAQTSELMFAADTVRKRKHHPGIVSWIIDRNVNITNVCLSRCKFCNYYRKPKDNDAYITTAEEYDKKIRRLWELGGDQLLLQGGLHPHLGLGFYRELFTDLKNKYPWLKLHALGPAEVHHLAKMEKCSYADILTELQKAGLDSLPGAGAEILADRVRKLISPAKCSADEWLQVMREAHKTGMATSATMMFGHIETEEERILHILKIRDLQNEKPTENPGFVAFISWPFQGKNTKLQEKYPVSPVTAEAYIRMVAISRLLLPNIENIQASWLTTGIETGKICLHAGANDLGSIMIEENVVSAAGASHTLDQNGMEEAIRDAGFIPVLRNQKYEFLTYPEV